MARNSQLYDVLAVSPEATLEEISRSYKKIALRCHPDKTNHDPQLTEKFKEATRAYEILKDNKKRNLYDRYGTDEATEVQNQPPPNPFPFMSTSFSQVFTDINSMFGSQTFQPFMNMNMNINKDSMKRNVYPVERKVVRGEDIHHTFKVLLCDMLYGKVVKFQLPRKSKCDHCKGYGCFNPQLCTTCKGSGQVLVIMQNQFSKLQEMLLCRECKGTGIIVQPGDECYSCDYGFVRENKIIRVNILPGSKDGDKCILKGEGDQGRNIVPGNVVIHLQEVMHPKIVRKFNDLYLEKDIDLKTALLGGEILIDGFPKEGENLKIHINTGEGPETTGEIVGTINPGTAKIVKGFGMPINNDIQNGTYLQLDDEVFDLSRYQRGNLFIKFNVVMPQLADFSSGDLQLLHQILPGTDNGEKAADASLSNLPGFMSPCLETKRRRTSGNSLGSDM